MASILHPPTQGSSLFKSVPLFLLALLGLIFLVTGCNQGTQTAGPRLSLRQDTYDFGKISPSGQVVKEVEFTNSGTQPLVLKDVLPVPPPEGG